jgi:hypothetical protein
MVTLPSVTLGKESLCRVQSQKYSAKLGKASQFWQISQLCRVRGRKALGKEFFFKKNYLFAECQTQGHSAKNFQKKN